MTATIHPEIWPRLQSPIPPDSDLEARIDAMVSAMTLEAKVGQIIQAGAWISGRITPEDDNK